MRRELDYIADDRAALRWALGCLAAGYRMRWTQRLRAPIAWRSVATGGALMLVIGIALQDRAGGQTAPPPPPAFEETACDPATKPLPKPRQNQPCVDRMTPGQQPNNSYSGPHGHSE
jgi:hypothetical protein